VSRVGLLLAWSAALCGGLGEPADVAAQAARGDSARPAGAASDPAALPPDTYADPGVEALLERAGEARRRAVEGIASYEGLMREHIYVGLTAFRFRRERGLFDQDRVALVRWEDDGDRYVQWLGARRRVPIVGSRADVQAEIDEDLPRELLREGVPPALRFDPWDDRLVFGESWFFHPLADSARVHYRYASGDTLVLDLPAQQQTLRMVEVLVRPRRPDVHLLAGSLWFDQETGALVRASYRPARPFDLELDAEPGEEDDVPGFLKPITAEIDYITVEYSLHEFRFWLPRRFALEGRFGVGRLLGIPLTVEWTVGRYVVNERTSELAVRGPLPPGWTRRERRVEDEDGEVRYETVVLPPADSVLHSALLTAERTSREPTAFTDGEIAELRETLQGLLPGRLGPRVRVSYGLADGLTRYNRVEGLSTGLAVEAPVGARLGLRAEGRIGTADGEPRGSLSLFRGTPERRWSLTGYRRLRFVSDWENPLGLAGSAKALLAGDDDGLYYRALGLELARTRGGRRVRRTWRLFYERHRTAPKETDFDLGDILGDSDDFPANIEAAPGTVAGAAFDLRWQAGIDPAGLIASGRAFAEGGVGDFDYWRWGTSLALTHPLGAGLAGAVEAGLGMAGDQAPPQRRFALGGDATFRGFESGDPRLRGAAFWFARAELANDFPAARVGLFGDVAWVGPDQRFGSEGWKAAVGIGGSLLDGLLRVDLARAVRGGAQWNLEVYADGLF